MGWLATAGPPAGVVPIDVLREYLALLAPLIVLWFVLLVAALRDLLRRPEDQLVGRSKLLWGAVVVCLSILGPLLYFAFGRRRE